MLFFPEIQYREPTFYVVLSEAEGSLRRPCKQIPNQEN